MILSKETRLAALLMINFESIVDAHGYLKSPRSRNYYANLNGKWSGGTASDPSPETCPHCLNIGGTEARCGLVGDNNYDLPPNSVGGIMPTVIQGCFKPGSIIDFESVLTAHHKGHFEFKACPISHGDVPTQECFDANPLTFISDELYGANVDPMYPERAYIPRTDVAGGLVRDNGGNYLFHHKYRLPSSLTGDLILLQWYYVTGNSCKDVGYDTYNWPVGFYPGDLPVCTQPLPEDGRGVPEQFWNCAEVKISNDCDAPNPAPTTTSSTSIATTTTGSTVTTSSTSTTSRTTTAPGTCQAATGACGPDLPCGNGLCCSQWGYCGTSEAYCGACCQSNCWKIPDSSTTQPSNKPTPIPSVKPTVHPTISATTGTTKKLTNRPTVTPTSMAPTKKSGKGPTISPTGSAPTKKPTAHPTMSPNTSAPSKKPTSTTNVPTKNPTYRPTVTPTTIVPTKKPSLFPVSSPISRAPTRSVNVAVETVLEASKDGINNRILLYQTPSMQWLPSPVYRYDDLLEALRVMYHDGVAGKYFYMGDDSPNGYKYGLVNIAAFLAQSMKETIQYNACDENSWDLVNGVYPVSNACGQLGQSYQDYKCSAEEAHMECPVKKEMKIKATTNAKWYGAPAPLYCGPKETYPFTGYWDYSKECNKPWANPPEYCAEYEGQKAGAFVNTSPIPNSLGRTDVEGCCFWGRGVIQTTGVCNFGKLNYYLGARAAEEGRDSRYPDINFCEQPDAICASEAHKELKWIAGMFYWVETLQSYNIGGWDYITELRKFVDNGMTGNSFIDAVSGIVNRGCHSPPCATGDVDGKSDRSSNFFKVLREFNI